MPFFSSSLALLKRLQGGCLGVCGILPSSILFIFFDCLIAYPPSLRSSTLSGWDVTFPINDIRACRGGHATLLTNSPGTIAFIWVVTTSSHHLYPPRTEKRSNHSSRFLGPLPGQWDGIACSKRLPCIFAEGCLQPPRTPFLPQQGFLMDGGE